MIEHYESVKNDHVRIMYDVIEKAVIILCKETNEMQVIEDNNIDELFVELCRSITEETDFETAVRFFNPITI